MHLRFNAVVIKILFAFILLTLSLVAAQSQSVLVIRDVTVIDMVSRAPKRGITVIVEGDRIVRMGRGLRTPKDATVIDGHGKFLIPGLWDMHVHALSEARFDEFSKLFLANGVTGIRDTGTTAEGFAMLGPLRRDIASGKRFGPRI